MITEPFDEMVERKRKSRLNAIDNMSADWRALVHEYGYSSVVALHQAGVVKARQGRHIIETVLRENSATLGAFSKQGVRTEVRS